MPWKGNTAAMFTGGSGQMAVMAELLHRNCNAAIPQMDIGTDLFAFRDEREDVARIQVKTAPGKRYKRNQGYGARFNIPIAQLERTDSPPLFYAFAVRVDNGWGDFIIISRTDLQELWNQGCGSENAGEWGLYLQFRRQDDASLPGEKSAAWTVGCGPFDFSDYRNAWESLPPLKPLEPL